MKKGILSRKKLMRTKRALVNAADNVKETIIHTPGKMTVYAKHNPYKTVGFTVLASVLLTQLVRLRHLRK